MKFRLLKRYQINLIIPWDLLLVKYPGKASRLTRTFLEGTSKDCERSILTRRILEPSSRTVRVYSQRKVFNNLTIQDCEEIITKERYDIYCLEADHSRKELTRLRKTIRCNGRELHIDRYLGWALPTFLELEIADPSEKPIVPEDILLVRDVSYTTRYLESDIALH